MVLAFHKPFDVLCQFTPDQPGQATLAQFGFPAGVYPVGRLDMDSEGLLLLSDEEGFNHRLLNPKFAHSRTYLAQVEGMLTESAIAKIAAGGIEIQGHRTRTCVASLLDDEPFVHHRNPPIRARKAIPTSWLEISLTEGKNRQVRRTTAAVGFPTLRLIRTRIGEFSAPDLLPGTWFEMKSQDIRKLWEA